MSEPKILYILECDHVMPGSIYAIDIDCYNCDAPRKIKDVHVYEWRSTCSGCIYKVWCGLSQPLANHNLNGHIRKHPSHTGKVLYLPNPLGVAVQAKIREANNDRTTPGRN